MAFLHLQRSGLLACSATLALTAATAATPALAVIPNENRTPTDIIDTEDRFRGVGMIITNVPGTTAIGSCTGTLINPRTVLFAAHCVNMRPETDYDGTTVRAAVAFNVNALPGLQSWFANSRSNPALSVFNVSRIFWDARSLENRAAQGFTEADIALAVLDRPAAGIPNWALLFSDLPAPATIDPVRGTGYHVNIVGYGRTGTATQGAITPSDFRRRAAENLLGGLHSLDDRNAVLFGPRPASLPQNLYQIDFDSQRRQTPFDFNVHRDNALPNEGTTAPGDSGGPLILGRANNRLANEDLVIGVLSGSSRFFAAQPFSSLGTSAFYQPLSLFWQYITATNPYRFVGAVAGNGNWEDPNRWVTLLDPGVRVINAAGQVVNGLPTTPELGRAGTAGDFGSVCLEFEDPLDTCTDVRTGIVTRTAPPRPASGSEGSVGIEHLRGSFSAIDLFGGEPAAGPGQTAQPEATTLAQPGEAAITTTTAAAAPAPSAAAAPTAATIGHLRGSLSAADLIEGGNTALPDTTTLAQPGEAAITTPDAAAAAAAARAPLVGAALTAAAIGHLSGSLSAADLIEGGNNALPDTAALPDTTTLPLPGTATLAEGASVASAAPERAGASANAPAPTPARLPAPTLANGLPGATGFVPNNVNPVVSADPARNVLPRFFDVTLSQAGTTTLSSTVTIDRLQLRGTAGLTIASAGNLTSLIDVSQFGGSTVTVNGRLTSAGDFTLFGGTIEGTGTIAAPFLTSVAGTISPGTAGTTGTLTLNGNLVLASGTTVLADITGAGAADRIVVMGTANLGGRVAIGGLANQVNGQGRVFTILTATGGITGAFAPVTISPILSQVFAVQNNALTMEVRAASYTTQINPTDRPQVAYAQLFDQNRRTAALAPLYALDFASGDTIRETFRSLAPVTEAAVPAVVGQTVNNLQTFHDARLREADRDRSGGRIAVIGTPVQTAFAALTPLGQPLGDALMGLAAQGEGGETAVGSIREDIGIYVSGGLINGDVAAPPGFVRETEVQGYYLAGGVEVFPGENSMVGVSGWFNAVVAETPLAQRLDSDAFAATVYGRHAFGNGPVLDAQLSIGRLGVDTRRDINFLGQLQALTTSSDNMLVSGAIGASYDLATALGVFSPGVEARYASVDLGPVTEQGGTLALTAQRQRFTSTQARAGVDYEQQRKGVQINGTMQFVHEFEEGPQFLAANFAQGTGPNANFFLNTVDRNWMEFGFSANFGEGPFVLGLGFDTTLGRVRAETRMVRLSGTYRF